MPARGRWYCWRRDRPTVASSARTGLRHHFDAMRRSRIADGTLRVGDGITDANDPLAAYPRFMHPHRHDAMIHGSLPNRSRIRFRRALIAHYIAGEARQVAHYYFPVLAMDGREVALEQGPAAARAAHGWTAAAARPWRCSPPPPPDQPRRPAFSGPRCQPLIVDDG